MITFDAFFKNHFKTGRISDDKLKKFTEDHLARLTQNNGGGTFTVILTDTTNAYTAYFGMLSSEDVAFSVQQSLTMTVDNIIKDFKNSVSQKEGLIRGTYNSGSPEYQKFFPHGMNEYWQLNKANAETLMTRMAAACTAHVADLGMPIVTLFTNYKTNFVNTRTAQLNKIGEVDHAKTGTAQNRHALETQLLKNLFTIGATFPGNVLRCKDFFSQSIIRQRKYTATDRFGRLKGLITDKETGNPLFRASIEILGTHTPICRSKMTGNYQSRKTPIGKYSVLFRAQGKPDKTIDITIVDDGDTTFDVQL
jgi:hypothetical protein